MKKRIIIILSCTMIALALLSVSMQILQKNETKTKQKALTATMPVSENVKGLKENTPSVFIAFHPECEHCQYEAKSINERHNDLENVNIVMFTVANDSMTKAFSKQYGLDSLKNVQIIADTTKEMEKIFGVKTIPTVFIYSAKNQLVKRYDGETKIEAILKNLQ
jgi:thioredoxin-related protein